MLFAQLTIGYIYIYCILLATSSPLCILSLPRLLRRAAHTAHRGTSLWFRSNDIHIIHHNKWTYVCACVSGNVRKSRHFEQSVWLLALGRTQHVKRYISCSYSVWHNQNLFFVIELLPNYEKYTIYATVFLEQHGNVLSPKTIQKKMNDSCLFNGRGELVIMFHHTHGTWIHKHIHTRAHICTQSIVHSVRLNVHTESWRAHTTITKSRAIKTLSLHTLNKYVRFTHIHTVCIKIRIHTQNIKFDLYRGNML